eukprot:COSAG06_NODE_5076_length_3743_cov_21.948957_6_plen_75_part_00
MADRSIRAQGRTIIVRDALCSPFAVAAAASAAAEQLYVGILRWRAVRSVARWQADGVGRWYESECLGVLTHIDR